MRRSLAHFCPAEQLVGQPRLARVEHGESLGRLPGGVRSGTHVSAKRDVRGDREHLPEPLDLVVGQRVHRVQQQCAHPWAQRPGGMFGGKCVQDGQQEGLGLAGARASGHDDVASHRDLADGLFLVPVQWPVQRHGLTGQAPERGFEDPLGNEVSQSGAVLVRRRGFQQRSLGQLTPCYLVIQGSGDARVTHGEQGLEVSPVAVDDQVAGRQGIERGGHAASSANRVRSIPAIRASARTRSMLASSGACRARSAQRGRQPRSKTRQASLPRAAIRATSAREADIAGNASHPPFRSG